MVTRRTCLTLCWALVALHAAERPASLEAIRSEQLKKDVYYLASDELKGRGAPSPGLDAAAEYIAKRFRKMGLRPASASGYFQQVPVDVASGKTWEVSLETRAGKFRLTPENSALMPGAAADFADAPVVMLNPETLRSVEEGELKGKVVVSSSLLPLRRSRGGVPLASIVVSESLSRMAGMMPRNEITLRDDAAQDATPRRTSVIASADPELQHFLKTIKPGVVEGAKASGRIDTAREPAELRNVVAILPGSDPALRDSYVIVSAHYDHLGEALTGEDKIRNGANDDASGVAAMLGVAKALTKAKPRRTIVFAAWTGEEAGGMGSRYYARHPLFPVAKTIANVNIEQIGRFDGEGGAGPKRMFATGYSYSDFGRLLTDAAKQVGVDAYAGPDAFFARSDNVFLAQAGVPAHTVGASLEFPDYHKPSDSAEKLDYENMALLTRAVAAFTASLANAAEGPRWDPENPDVAEYRKARETSAATAGAAAAAQ